MLLFRRLCLLIADVQHPTVAVLIDQFEPAAAQRIVINAVVVTGVVAENPARAEPIANQRARIFYIAGRNLIIEL